MDGSDIDIPSKQWSGLEKRDFSLILLKGKVPFEKGFEFNAQKDPLFDRSFCPDYALYLDYTQSL